MLSSFRSSNWFRLPVFPDEEQTRLAGLLIHVTRIFIVASLFSGLPLIAADPSRVNIITTGYGSALILAASLLALRWAWNGKIHRASWIIILTLLAAITAPGLIYGMTQFPASAYLLVIMVAALLLGRHGMIQVGLISLFALAVVTGVNILGLFNLPAPRAGVINSTIVSALVSSLAIILMHVTITHLQDALDRSHHSEKALRQLNAQLETRVFERTAELTTTNAVLRESEERYRALVENADDSIYMVDKSCNVLSVNRHGEELFGEQPSRLIGKSIFELFPKELAEEYAFSLDEVFKTGAATTIESKLIAGSREFWVSAILSPIKDDQGNVTTVIGISRDVTNRRRMEEQLRVSLQEKEALLKEIHHRIKNNLQIISSLLHLQSRKIQSAELKGVFLESQSRITAMALIHEKLYRSEGLAHIPFANYARELALTLYQIYGMGNSRVTVSVEGGGLELDIDNTLPCGLILNEIVSNSLKYAFPEDLQGQIQIELSMADDDHFHLVISDNGVGLPADFEARTASSLGTRLIERLAEQMEGNMERNSSSSGTSYHITFPRRV